MLDEFESNIEEPQGEPGQAEQLEVEEPDSMAFLDGITDDDRPRTNVDAFESASVPFTEGDYDTAGADDLNDGLVSDFKGFAKTEGMTQGLFSKLIGFAAAEYDSVDSMRSAFTGFCNKNHIGRTLAERIIGFVDNAEAQHLRTVEQVQRFSKAARGRPRSAANARQIAEVRESAAFKEKGVSTEQRQLHKAAVKLLFELLTE